MQLGLESRTVNAEASCLQALIFQANIQVNSMEGYKQTINSVTAHENEAAMPPHKVLFKVTSFHHLPALSSRRENCMLSLLRGQ